MHKYLGALVSLLMLVFQSCSTNKSEVQAIRYFDIPGFFRSEIDALEASNSSVIKTVETDGKTEQKQVRPDSWRDELAVFSAFDLNKSSFIGKYQVDSTIKGDLLFLNYRSLDAKLPIKNCAFTFKNSQLITAQAHKLESSLVLKSEMRWRFVPDSGYSVSGSQQVRGLEPTLYFVSAIFAN